MCFRPAEMSMKVCPECGANNKPIATECASCGAPLAQMKVDFDADQASLDAFATMPPMGTPSAPSAPAMPSAPGAPKAPSAPSAPTPPSAPGA